MRLEAPRHIAWDALFTCAAPRFAPYDSRIPSTEPPRPLPYPMSSGLLDWSAFTKREVQSKCTDAEQRRLLPVPPSSVSSSKTVWLKSKAWVICGNVTSVGERFQCINTVQVHFIPLQMSVQHCPSLGGGGGGRLAAQFSSGCGRDVWFTCCGGRPRWADNRRSAETATLPCIILCIFLSFELRTWEEQGEMNRRVWLGEAVWFLAAVTTAKWKYLQNNMYTSWRTGIWISQSVRKGVAMYYGRCRQSFLQ